MTAKEQANKLLGDLQAVKKVKVGKGTSIEVPKHPVRLKAAKAILTITVGSPKRRKSTPK